MTLKEGFGKIFNPFNLLALIGSIPIVLYLCLNNSVGIKFNMGQMPFFYWLGSLFLLVIFEVLVFIPFIYKQIKRSPEFYLLVLTCVMCLFIQMGNSSDFNSRVELPLNFFMTLQLAIFIGKWSSVSKIQKFLFLIISAFALVTPVLEISRVVWKTVSLHPSEYKSLSYDSVFELDVLRDNFVTDSALIDNKHNKYLWMFKYD